MMQEMSQFRYTNVPPYNLRFTETMPMFPFVPQTRSNVVITGMNSNFTTIQPPLYVPFPPRFSAPVAARFSAPVAGNVIPMPF